MSIVKFILLFLILTKFNLKAQNIFDLARSGNVATMQVYLAKHPEDIDLQSEQGTTPFLLACYRGNNDVAKFLANHGADMKKCYLDGSALYAVIFKNNIEMLDFMLQNNVGANDSCQFQQLGFPIHFALNLKRYDVIELLLNHGADVNIKDPQNKSVRDLLLIYNDEKLSKLFDYEK